MAHDWRAFLIPLLMVSMLPALADAPPKSASDPVVRASAAFLALEAGEIDRTTYVFRLKWTNGSIDYVCGFDDASQKIAKLYFLPGPGA